MDFYQPLSASEEEVRLLRIPPDEGLAGIRSFDHDEYTIPPDERTSTVGSNLAKALLALRSCNVEYIWVDAICINQTNLEERNKQVMLMRQIYESARLVIIWLGEEAGGSTMACRFIELLARTSRQNDSATRLEELVTSESHNRDWLALRELLERPYWTRAWVLQEVAVGRHVQLLCGYQTMSWDDLIQASQFLSKYWALIQKTSLTARAHNKVKGFNYLREARARNKDLNLVQALVISRRAQSSDLRDAVYANLGLANDALTLVKNPTYRLGVESVYKTLVKSYIQEKNDLTIICLSENGNSCLQLPSWVPDWSQTIGLMPLQPSLIEPGRPLFDFRACAEMQPVSQGLSLDEVDGLGWHPAIQAELEKPIIQHKGVSCAYPTPKDTLSAICRSLTPDVTRDPIRDEYVRATEHIDKLFAHRAHALELRICSASSPRGHEAQDILTSASAFEIWYRQNRDLLESSRPVHLWVRMAAEWTGSDDPSEDLNDRNSSSPTSWARFEGNVAHMMCRRRFLVTAKGYLGMAPETAMQGDRICILSGCSVPVILRPIGNHFVFVGACYVHGVMHGEAVPDFSKSLYPLQEFQIRCDIFSKGASLFTDAFRTN